MAAESFNGERYNRKITYHDREYQDYALRREAYLAPIDLEEETRLRDQHEMMKMIYRDWDNSLHPNFIQDPESILDCGFGSGNWASDLAEYDPNCTVMGVDICPLMAPPDQPDNMDLQIANLNERMDFAEPGTFDLIHSRFVAGGIAATRWPNYLRDMHRLLRKNGWVQLTEWDLHFRSEIGDMDALQALQEWSRLYTQALGLATRPEGKKSLRVTQDCETWLRMAGFVNVSTDVRDIATCPWPADPHQRSIGEANLANMRDLVRSLGLYPITHRQLRSIEEFQVLVDHACAELGNVNAKPYIRLYTVFGRKQ
ncbi:hypothetical protein HRR83_008106 [Exophiala dermatitidis]|uniref:Methyltransferase domain-containing protein n=1 Tax=Exophiala dermatitidis (strain ATCC 34100 / CBS 525.76 / NIH/UT8656) TaxID=858893 RepID=H6BT65_EXODN|nr:uncharacterized protein HMPREF1120_02485 [Exophiala dermatitidis NIH/UT8656]KAJ4505028.1 hypothetical protein HRR74_008856 [Exophiala dermatitidis]EHY54315.1 hypothetical protein HMPREF1120_02485 [Exophiala dermatitidis NIH/UT8656]KAJ4513536.1 hypothetical protein HRR73_005694 [Exophiala dermatitidis]KAJ4574740.1 hypothetical protein HRR81_004645 [Exophiala dermatitidis]KAJ4589428.1 hypothetical protein HRR83_008106 [Exophiala dermatitidis]